MLSLSHLDKMSAYDRACKNVENPDQFIITMKQASLDIGVKTFSYHQLSSDLNTGVKTARVVSHFGYLDQWLEYYRTLSPDEMDPFVAFAIANNRPFWWSEILPQLSDTVHGRNIAVNIRGLGLKSGLFFPVFSPGQDSGFFALGFQKRRSDFSQAKINALQWACQLTHHRHLELIEEIQSAQKSA